MAKLSSLSAFLFLGFLCAWPARAVTDLNASVDAVCPIIDSSARAQALPVAFLARLIWQESSFRPDAVSPVGARGIAQFMPATAAERGLANPDDPEAAIPKAAEFLASLRLRFGNLGLAAAAYNGGATRVANWLSGAGDLAPETHDYVMILTRHPVEDWRAGGAASLTDDIVFPESSCVRSIASIRGVKEEAMWNDTVSALNAYPPVASIEKFADAYLSAPLAVALVACAALIYFLAALVRMPIKAIREELRRNHSHLEALLRSGANGSVLSGPVFAAGPQDVMRAERAERLHDRPQPPEPVAAPPRIDDAPKADAAEQQAASAAAAPENKEAPPGERAAGEPGAIAAAKPPDQPRQVASPAPEIFPILGPGPRHRPAPLAKQARPAGKKALVIGAGLALSAACGAIALFGSPVHWSFAAANSRATAGLAWAGDLVKAPIEAITGPSEREEKRLRDLGDALAEVTARLDRIERETAARMDRLDQHVDQDSSAKLGDIGARLDRLEQKAAAPMTQAGELADVMARLDRLEKKTAVTTAPAPQFAEIASRLEALEKKAAVGAPSAPAAPRADAAASSPAKPLAPAAAPKPATLAAKTEPSASPDMPGAPRAVLRDFSVEDVRNGIAMVHSRNGGLQPVAPGDELPGAGRVLRMERRGGDWIVVTSLGVIARSPAR